MKKNYETPSVEVVTFSPAQYVAYMNFGQLQDAAINGNKGNGAITVNSTSEFSSDVYLPR